MSNLLGLAADFIDRVANPRYGAEVNEAYAARLDELLKRDPSLAERLAEERLDAEDVDLLSTSGWLWYLGFRHDHGTLPQEEFLDALYAEADDPIVRLSIVEAVTIHPEIVGRFRERPERERVTLEALPQYWLRDRLVRLVAPSDQQGADHDLGDRDFEDRMGEAMELATSFLQIGNQVALETLRALLSSAGRQREALAGLVEGIISASGAEEESVQAWRRSLGLE